MNTGIENQIHTVTIHFVIFDQDAFDLAMEDLQHADVFGDDEGPDDNTIVENLDLLLCHLDVLASYREAENISFYDVGIERVAK